MHGAQEVWPEVLRCISRFEHVSQSGPSDSAFFSPEAASPGGLAKIRRGFFSTKPAKPEGAPLPASFSAGEAGAGVPEWLSKAKMAVSACLRSKVEPGRRIPAYPPESHCPGPTHEPERRAAVHWGQSIAN